MDSNYHIKMDECSEVYNPIWMKHKFSIVYANTRQVKHINIIIPEEFIRQIKDDEYCISFEGTKNIYIDEFISDDKKELLNDAE